MQPHPVHKRKAYKNEGKKLRTGKIFFYSFWQFLSKVIRTEAFRSITLFVPKNNFVKKSNSKKGIITISLFIERLKKQSNLFNFY
jgi:hypothetical protein